MAACRRRHERSGTGCDTTNDSGPLQTVFYQSLIDPDRFFDRDRDRDWNFPGRVWQFRIKGSMRFPCITGSKNRVQSETGGSEAPCAGGIIDRC